MRTLSLIAMAICLAGSGALYAQDQTQDQTRDRLQECDNLNEQDCADLLRIRDRLRDCDGVATEECASLLRERDRLQDCAADRDQDRDRDQDCDRTGGSNNN